MKKRQYLLIRAWLSVGLAAFFTSLLLYGDIDRSVIYLGFVFIGGTVFMAYRYFKQASVTDSEDVMNAPPPNATDTQLLRFYKRTLLLCFVVFPLLTLFVIYDVNGLLSGNTQSNELWDYVSFLYRNFGYWPTILFAPSLGIICILINFRKISVLKSKY